MDEKLPPFFRLTSEDHGGVAVIAALCTIIISLSVSGIRSIVASKQRVEFQRDDAFFYVASFLGSASSICIYRAVLVGLGKHIEVITTQELDSYYKLFYVAQLTSILSMTASKFSVIMLLKRIAQSDSRSFKFGYIMVILWSIFSFFALAFQCGVPKPWIFIPERCNTHGYLQYPIIAFNILSDAILATGILPTIWGLHVARHTRITVMVLFGLRLSVSIIAIGELLSVIRSVSNPDQPWVNLSRSIWMLMVTHTSLITSTIPRTHSFWSSLTTGKANAGITLQEYELSSPSNSRSSPFHSLTNPSTQEPKFYTKFIPKKHRSPRIPDFDIVGDREGHRGGDKGNLQVHNWGSARSHSTSRKRSTTYSRTLERRTSQEPLQLVPKGQSDLQTRVYSTCRKEGNRGENRGRSESGGYGGSAGHASEDEENSINSQSLRGGEGVGDFGVWREREVVMQVEYVDRGRVGG